MATVAPLNKGTNRGFTVIPNRVVDQILASESSHAVDALALALYLVRHIPGQRGSLALAGEFSQGALCQDLGWGRTNRARLKRAIADLERLTFVVSELRDNNTVVLHIDAELSNEVGEQRIPTGYEKSSHPGQKDFSHPPCKNFSQAQASRAFICINNLNNNTKQNTNNHLPDVTRQQQHETTLPKDDDVEKLLDLYCKTFTKSVSLKIRNSFAENYNLNQRPYDLVVNAFQQLSKHPKLRHDTASPNAVWELDYMQKAARTFDAKMRQIYFDEAQRRRTSVDTIKNMLSDFAKTSGYDLEAMLSHFQNDFVSLEKSLQGSDGHIESTLLESRNIGPHFESLCSEGGEPDFLHETVVFDLENIDSGANQSASDTLNLAQLDQVIEATHEPKIEIYDAIDFDKEEISTSEGRAAQLTNCHQLTYESSIRETSRVPQELLSTRSKLELRTLIDSFLQKPITEGVRQRLAMLSELASVENTTLDMLHGLIKLHANQTQINVSCLNAA